MFIWDWCRVGSEMGCCDEGVWAWNQDAFDDL